MAQMEIDASADTFDPSCASLAVQFVGWLDSHRPHLLNAQFTAAASSNRDANGAIRSDFLAQVIDHLFAVPRHTQG